ncbi:MAG TPA: hypothetical protein DCQ34_10430 [Chitinophagaceae bacterium]|nr:hypothetical protein [Chitinophagaceae bacterium]
MIPNWLIMVAGAGQIFTALIYPYVRHRVFDWYNDIRKLKPLNQEIAKTYGRYIQGLNFGFGLITMTCTEELQNQTPLALALTGLVAAYWTGKIITQFAYYPMYQIPNKAIFKIGEWGMNALFMLFATVFLWLFAWNLSHVI